jgi:hypothetical protein
LRFDADVEIEPIARPLLSSCSEEEDFEQNHFIEDMKNLDFVSDENELPPYFGSLQK